MATLRIKNGQALAKRRKQAEREAKRERLFDGTVIRPGLSTSFRGNASAALTVTNTDRTLGSKGFRLRALSTEIPGYEPGQAGQVDTTAAFVAHPEPMAFVTATETDSIGKESVTPKANLESVPFEHRLGYLARGQRLPRRSQRGVDNTVYSVTVREGNSEA